MTTRKTHTVATLAVFLALGGSAYAALQLPHDSSGREQLKQHSAPGETLPSRRTPPPTVAGGADATPVPAPPPRHLNPTKEPLR